jgi:hypothetical protein
MRCYGRVISMKTEGGTEYAGNIVNVEKIVDGMRGIENVDLDLHWRKTEKEAHDDLLDYCNKRRYLLEDWKPKRVKKQ